MGAAVEGARAAAPEVETVVAARVVVEMAAAGLAEVREGVMVAEARVEVETAPVLMGAAAGPVGNQWAQQAALRAGVAMEVD